MSSPLLRNLAAIDPDRHVVSLIVLPLNPPVSSPPTCKTCIYPRMPLSLFDPCHVTLAIGLHRHVVFLSLAEVGTD